MPSSSSGMTGWEGQDSARHYSPHDLTVRRESAQTRRREARRALGAEKP